MSGQHSPDLQSDQEEPDLLANEDQGAQLLANYSQLTKRKPIENAKKKVQYFDSRSLD
jgi:hypothetical protein